MLTRKQRWRRVRGGTGSRLLGDPFFSSSSDAPSMCSTIGRLPHPIDSLAIGDSLLHLLGSAAGAGNDRRMEDAEPPPPPRSNVRNVRFNHQVRVVLVPSRTELKNLKADMWWGEEDYYEFRREYIVAMKAAVASPSTDTSDRRPAAETETDTETDTDDHNDNEKHPTSTPPPTLPSKTTTADLCSPPSTPPPPPSPLRMPEGSMSSGSLNRPCRETETAESNKEGVNGTAGVVVAASISHDALAAAAASASASTEGRGAVKASPALEHQRGFALHSPCVAPAAVVKPAAPAAAEIDILEDATGSPLPPPLGLPSPLSSCFSAPSSVVAAIAMAAGGDGEEPCRTQSMSSVSERTDAESSFSDSETEANMGEEMEDDEDIDLCRATRDSPQARDDPKRQQGGKGRRACPRDERTLIYA